MKESQRTILGIFGAGGMGRETLELAEQINQFHNLWDDIVFVSDYDDSNIVQNRQVYQFTQANKYFGDSIEYIIAIGEPLTRKKLFERIQLQNCKIATLIHPQVHIPKTTTISQGVIVGEVGFLACNVTLEENVVLQPGVCMGHDCVIKKHSFLSGLACLGGGCDIGEEVFLGQGATLKEKIKIGNGSIVSMGAIVFKDVPELMIAAGNPARCMMRNEDRKVFK